MDGRGCAGGNQREQTGPVTCRGHPFATERFSERMRGSLSEKLFGPCRGEEMDLVPGERAPDQGQSSHKPEADRKGQGRGQDRALETQDRGTKLLRGGRDSGLLRSRKQGKLQVPGTELQMPVSPAGAWASLSQTLPSHRPSRAWARPSPR